MLKTERLPLKQVGKQGWWVLEIRGQRDIPGYDPRVIGRGLDDQTFRREVQGDWTAVVGRLVYPEFGPIHCAKEPLPFDPELPLILGWDVGGSPWSGTPACCISQVNHYGQWLIYPPVVVSAEETIGILEFAREWVARELIESYAEPNGLELDDLKVFHFGDPAGNNPPPKHLAERNKIAELRSTFDTIRFGERFYGGVDEYGDPIIEETPGLGWLVQGGEGLLSKRLAVVRARLNANLRGHPALIVDPDAGPVLDAFQGGYHYHQRSDGRYELDPMKNHASHCLTGDTLIETRRGQVPICEVTTSDQVMTRQGWKRVLKTWDNGVRPVIEVRLADGRRARSTADHRFWTDAGWVEAGSLGYNRVCSVKPLPTKGFNTTGIREPRILVIATTSSEAQVSKPDAFTWLFGKRPMALCLPGCTSTIRMETSPTTNYPTWKYLLQRIMSDITLLLNGESGVGRTCFESLHPLTLGTARQKALSGIGNMAKRQRQRLSPGWRLIPAFIARVNSRPIPGENKSSSAPRSALRQRGGLPGWMTRIGIAWFAGIPSGATGIPSSDIVPCRVVGVQELSEPEQVFDLTVEDAHEFYANGILVHNCMNAVEYAASRLTHAVAQEREAEDFDPHGLMRHGATSGAGRHRRPY